MTQAAEVLNVTQSAASTAIHALETGVGIPFVSSNGPAPDLHQNLEAADRFELDLVKEIDAYIARTEMTAPKEALRDGFAQQVMTRLDLGAASITNVIWATSDEFDFSLVRLPIFDGEDTPSRRVA